MANIIEYQRSYLILWGGHGVKSERNKDGGVYANRLTSRRMDLGWSAVDLVACLIATQGIPISGRELGLLVNLSPQAVRERVYGFRKQLEGLGLDPERVIPKSTGAQNGYYLKPITGAPLKVNVDDEKLSKREIGLWLPGLPEESIVSRGRLRFNVGTRVVTLGNQDVQVTRREATIMRILAENNRKVPTNEIAEILGLPPHAVRVNIDRINRKSIPGLGPVITSSRGGGYSLKA